VKNAPDTNINGPRIPDLHPTFLLTSGKELRKWKSDNRKDTADIEYSMTSKIARMVIRFFSFIAPLPEQASNLRKDVLSQCEGFSFFYPISSATHKTRDRIIAAVVYPASRQRIRRQLRVCCDRREPVFVTAKFEEDSTLETLVLPTVNQQDELSCIMAVQDWLNAPESAFH
jgi:hypothetical protein